MTERTCATCRHFVAQVTPDGVIVYSESDLRNYCHRPIKGWFRTKPWGGSVYGNHWCGEHTPKETPHEPA